MRNWSFNYEEWKQMDWKQKENLPDNNVPGLYRFISGNKKPKILYIGKSTNLNKRLFHHPVRDASYVTEHISRIEVITGLSLADIDLLEIYLINKYKPKYNKDCKSDTNFTLDFSFIESIIPEWEEFYPYEFIEREWNERPMVKLKKEQYKKKKELQDTIKKVIV